MAWTATKDSARFVVASNSSLRLSPKKSMGSWRRTSSTCSNSTEEIEILSSDDSNSIESLSFSPAQKKKVVSGCALTLDKPLHPFFTQNATSWHSNTILPPGTRMTPSSRTAASMASVSTADAMEPSNLLRNDSLSPLIARKTKSGSENEAQLPIFTYKDFDPPPNVYYTKSEAEANDLVGQLNGPLGFDLEWRVTYKRGAPQYPVGMLQMCDERTILLLHIKHMRNFPSRVKAVLESSSVVKMGASIANDGRKLMKDFGVQSTALVELGAMALQADPVTSGSMEEGRTHRSIVGLQETARRYLGKYLRKGSVRTQNWDKEDLGSEMLEYAANDAYAALMVYKHLSLLAQANQIRLETKQFTSYPVMDRSTTAAPPSAVVLPSRAAPLPRPQAYRAHRMWYHERLSLTEMCRKLPVDPTREPLANGTVVQYIFDALEGDSSLPYDKSRLRELVAQDQSHALGKYKPRYQRTAVFAELNRRSDLEVL